MSTPEKQMRQWMVEFGDDAPDAPLWDQFMGAKVSTGFPTVFRWAEVA